MENIDKIGKVWFNLEETFAKSPENSRLSFLQTLLGYKEGKYNTTSLLSFMGDGLSEARMQEFNDLRALMLNAEKGCECAVQQGREIQNLDDYVREDFTQDVVTINDYDVLAEEHCDLEKAIACGVLSNAVIEKDGEILNIMIADKRFLPLAGKEEVTTWIYNAPLEENSFFQIIYYLLVQDVVAGTLVTPKIFITKDMFEAICRNSVFTVSTHSQILDRRMVTTKTLSGDSYENECAVFECKVQDKLRSYVLTVVEV